MKFYILCLIILCSSNIFSQTTEVSDSLLEQICRTLIYTRNLPDSERLHVISEKYIIPILSQLEKSKQKDSLNYVFVRLQKTCTDFKDICDRAYPSKGDWIKVDTKPSSVLSQKYCLDFFKIENYYYLEQNGDTTYLTLKNNIWEDHFKDGTFSKLKVNWIRDCEFEIEFLESNNDLRKNFSKPGEKFRYRVLEKFKNYYKMSAEIPESHQFLTFKMHY